MIRKLLTIVPVLGALLLVSQKDAWADFVCAQDGSAVRSSSNWVFSESSSSEGIPEVDSDGSDADDGDFVLDAALLNHFATSVPGGMSSPTNDFRSETTPVGSMTHSCALASHETGDWMWVEGHPRLPSARARLILDPPRFMSEA